jgi:hypothetical protein
VNRPPPLQMPVIEVGVSTVGDDKCGITVKCRGVEWGGLGMLGIEHCDAQVKDASGKTSALSGGPSGKSPTSLQAWNVSPPKDPFTGRTVYEGTRCTAVACMIQSTDAWNRSATKPVYNGKDGPNSNTWLKGMASGCGVSLPISSWGSRW